MKAATMTKQLFTLTDMVSTFHAGRDQGHKEAYPRAPHATDALVEALQDILNEPKMIGDPTWVTVDQVQKMFDEDIFSG